MQTLLLHNTDTMSLTLTNINILVELVSKSARREYNVCEAGDFALKITRPRLTHEELVKALETGFPVSLSLHEVTQLLGIKKNLLYTAIEKGKFPQPLAISSYNFRVWGTAEVAQWMRHNGIPFPTLEKAE